jgi:hypothetical protein
MVQQSTDHESERMDYDVWQINLQECWKWYTYCPTHNSGTDIMNEQSFYIMGISDFPESVKSSQASMYY